MSPENSLWRNLLGFIAIAMIWPFLMLFTLASKPFSRPRKMSVADVATLLRKCIDDTATVGEIDYFICSNIADPTLDHIKDEVGAIYGPGWGEEEANNILAQLLCRAKAIEQSVQS